MADDDMLAELMNRPGWHARAACRGRVDLLPVFFPARGQHFGAAVALCRACEVRDECEEFALAHSERDLVGVWGGTTARQRRTLARERALETSPRGEILATAEEPGDARETA